jgi:tetratricopeptide (TPR) repeat protein
MDKKPPAPYDLNASAEWIKWKFGVKGQARSALRHVEQCLNEIASREYDFLTTKANLLSYLEKWRELKSLLAYLDTQYPNNAQVMLEQAEFLSAHGHWQKALSLIRRAERRVAKGQSWLLENLYSEKLECLVALDRVAAAKNEAKRILKKHRGFSIIRSALRSIEDGTYKRPEAYAWNQRTTVST